MMGVLVSKKVEENKYGSVDSNNEKEKNMVVNEKVASESEQNNLSGRLNGLRVLEDAQEGSMLNSESLGKWEKEFSNDRTKLLAQNALGGNLANKVVGLSDAKVKNESRHLFNNEVEIVGSPSHLNNQRSSGRCWIFATCNVIRSRIIKNYNLKDDEFQLSQSYLYFYDQLEKANFFLENVLETTDQDLSSRVVNFLFLTPTNDGGQWDMIINVINKYGLVPYEIFPDNAQTSNTRSLGFFINEKLREYGLILRNLKSEAVSRNTIYSVKNSMVKEVYEILAAFIGTPPKPNDAFTWEFKDKNGAYKSYDTTPSRFYVDHAQYDVSNFFSLINDPRNSYEALYTVDRLNNVKEGKPVEYVNADISILKESTIKMIKDNEPVFFGCDVGKFGERDTGVLDTNAFDYALAFGTSINNNKAQRLQTGSSQMTHAMVITGVHLDPKTKKPLRWKIENSWGADVGDKGYYVMTDAWFDQYVFQVVTNKKYVEKKLYNIWKEKKYNILPIYDPMGSLA